MTKVLVPFDDSEAAMRALRYAMGVAEETHVVNALPRADTPTLLLHMTQDNNDKAQLELGRSVLGRACELLDDAKRSYRTHVILGDPAREIVRIAKSESVDLIVMGTRGMGALGGWLLGSTATKVIHLAEVPVTLVK